MGYRNNTWESLYNEQRKGVVSSKRSLSQAKKNRNGDDQERLKPRIFRGPLTPKQERRRVVPRPESEKEMIMGNGPLNFNSRAKGNSGS